MCQALGISRKLDYMGILQILTHETEGKASCSFQSLLLTYHSNSAKNRCLRSVHNVTRQAQNLLSVNRHLKQHDTIMKRRRHSQNSYSNRVSDQ